MPVWSPPENFSGVLFFKIFLFIHYYTENVVLNYISMYSITVSYREYQTSIGEILMVEIKYPLKSLSIRNGEMEKGLIIRGEADIGYKVVVEVVHANDGKYYVVTGDHPGIGFTFGTFRDQWEHWDHEVIDEPNTRGMVETINAILDFYVSEDKGDVHV